MPEADLSRAFAPASQSTESGCFEATKCESSVALGDAVEQAPLSFT